MSSQTVDEMLEGYFLATTKAIGTLFKEDLLPHSLVIIYSTIDTCGLLDAPVTQTEATGESFQIGSRSTFSQIRHSSSMR